MTTPGHSGRNSNIDAAFAQLEERWAGRPAEHIGADAYWAVARTAGGMAVTGATGERPRRPGGFRRHDSESWAPEKIAPDEAARLMAETQKQSLAVGRAHGAFIAEARARGASPNEIKESMIDAMNRRVIPPVVFGATYRGGQRVLKILHGEVPPDLFRFAALHMPEDKPGEDPKTLKRPEEFGSLAIEDYNFNLPDQANPHDPTAFYVESVILPGAGMGRHNAENVRKGLARIEAAMAPPPHG